MPARNDIDALRFPSGLSVRQAKANAKKLRSEFGIKLHEAQRKIAAGNGLDLPWEQALEAIRSGQGTRVDNTALEALELASPPPHPVLRIEYQASTVLDQIWFKSLPHVMELIDEVFQRGRRYGIVFEESVLDDDETQHIRLILDFKGCSRGQEMLVMTIPHVNEALSSVSSIGSRCKGKLIIDSVVVNRGGNFTQIATQSINDFLFTDAELTSFAKIMGVNVHLISGETNEYDDQPRVMHKEFNRKSNGFNFKYAMSDNNIWSRCLSSSAFLEFARMGESMIFEGDKYTLCTTTGGIGFDELKLCGGLVLTLHNQIVVSVKLTQIGLTLIQDCMELLHEISRGRSIEPINIHK